MATPIAETPILRGEDARRFLEHLENPPKSPEWYAAEYKRCRRTAMRFMRSFNKAQKATRNSTLRFGEKGA